jgi:hypothetical protein
MKLYGFNPCQLPAELSKFSSVFGSSAFTTLGFILLLVPIFTVEAHCSTFKYGQVPINAQTGQVKF